MKKKTKRLLTVIALFLYVAVIYTAYAIYKSIATGTVTAKSAAWVIHVNGTDIVKENTFTMDNITWDNTESGAAEGTIAPGSVGTVDIVIDATGTEVPVGYEVTIGDVTVGDETLDNSNFTVSLKDSTSAISDNKHTATGHIAYSTEENAMKRTITLQIVWNVDYSDEASEKDNAMAAKDIQIPVKVKASLNAQEEVTLLLYDVFKNEARRTDVDSSELLVKAYTGEHQDSMDASKSTKTIYYWAGTSSNYSQILAKNNVVFGGYCWQMIRTTDTGGVKLLYSGVATKSTTNGKTSYTCSSTIGNIGTSAFNTNYNSPAYVGYMYGTVYTYQNTKSYSGYLYGNSFTYDETTKTYKLKDTQTGLGTNNHYTCWNSTGTCSTISYVYTLYNSYAYYINISGGKSIEDALEEMFSNTTDSTIKTAIDTWYESNMTAYTDYLEDIIFCNDRSISGLGGWDPNGGRISEGWIYFGNSEGLTCQNETDSFSVSNEKAKLKYPVGLATYNEMELLGYNSLRDSSTWYWLGSPLNFSYNAIERNVNSGGYLYYRIVDRAGGVRPLVSLRHGITYTSGSGSLTDPYVVGVE